MKKQEVNVNLNENGKIEISVNPIKKKIKLTTILSNIYPFATLMTVIGLIWFIWENKIPLILYQSILTFLLVLYGTVFLMMCIEVIKQQKDRI